MLFFKNLDNLYLLSGKKHLCPGEASLCGPCKHQTPVSGEAGHGTKGFQDPVAAEEVASQAPADTDRWDINHLWAL